MRMPKRHADQGRDADHDHGAHDGVSEAAALLERGRRELGEERNAELLSSAPDQHPQDGEQRNQRRQRHARHDPAQEMLKAVRGRRRESSRSAKSTPRKRIARQLPPRPCVAGSLPALSMSDGVGFASLISLRLGCCALCRISAPNIFTTRVIASSTSAAYIRTRISFGPASGKLLASRAARVLAGEKSETVSDWRCPPAWRAPWFRPARGRTRAQFRRRCRARR